MEKTWSSLCDGADNHQTGASHVIYQFYTVTSLGNAQLAVDADLRNAGLWLMRDGSQGQTFTSTPGVCVPFAFNTGPQRGVVYTYSFSGSTLSRQDIAKAVEQFNTLAIGLWVMYPAYWFSYLAFEWNRKRAHEAAAARCRVIDAFHVDDSIVRNPTERRAA
jgi:hypothetical protein